MISLVLVAMHAFALAGDKTDDIATLKEALKADKKVYRAIYAAHESSGK